VSIFSGITGVIVNDTSAGTTGVTNLSAAQAANVTVLAAHSTGAVTIGVKDATTPGQIDTVKILAKPVATAPNTAIDLTGLTMAGVEKLELTASTGTATTTLTMTNSTDLDSVKLFGASPVDVATGAIAQKINLAIDASGMTAQATGTTTATLSAAAATGTNGIALTGSAGDDIIRDSSGGNDVIVGGAGNDQIFFTGGTDIITGGAGADIINAGSTTSSASSANTFTLKFAAGDSVSKAGAANGYDATVTDSVIAIDNAGVFSADSGNKFTIDTADSAAAVTFGTAAITLGTTTVTNAYDFHVYYDAAALLLMCTRIPTVTRCSRLANSPSSWWVRLLTSPPANSRSPAATWCSPRPNCCTKTPGGQTPGCLRKRAIESPVFLGCHECK